MDFVKREDNLVDEENYKNYLENLQKSHRIEQTDYQHTQISREQLHQAVQSSLNHNFQLPLSPHQMSTLMLKTNHLARSFNFNDLPTHLQKNLAMEFDLLNVSNELTHNLRHDELSQSLSRNLDVTLSRTINNEIDLHNGLSHVQNYHEQELARSITADLTQNLNRLNEISQNLRDNPHELGAELDLSQLHRHILDQTLNHDDRRTPITQYIDNSILEQHLTQRLDQNIPLRLDQTVGRLDQRIDHTLEQRLDQRLVNGLIHEQRQLDQGENIFPMPFHIKSEQEDEVYFYDNANQGVNSNNLNGDIPQPQHSQTSSQNLPPEQVYTYNNHLPIPALNPIDLYSRNQNFVQSYSNVPRDDPQNLVVHRQFENASPYVSIEAKKKDGEGGKKETSKNEEPKENLKPTDHNKLYYEYTNEYGIAEKNENDSSLHNKITEDLSMSIKGEYACYKCNEVFPSKRILKQHSKACENVENNELEKIGKFSCTQCPYRCQSPAILKIHERTHTGEKPYACTFCDYKSGQKNNVAKHILVHMKQKPFRCQFCDYRCAQKNNLVVHERTHTGYKPFACPYCDYRTVQKPNLVKHMYLHTDQKPFSCDMCNYRCVQKTNLTKHKQRHLNDKDSDKVEVRNQIKPYKPRQKSVKCPYCSYRCVQKASLEKHMQFKHPDQSDVSQETFEGLNLMKNGEICDTVHNLSVKKVSQFVCDEKVLESQS